MVETLTSVHGVRRTNENDPTFFRRGQTPPWTGLSSLFDRVVRSVRSRLSRLFASPSDNRRVVSTWWKVLRFSRRIDLSFDDVNLIADDFGIARRSRRGLMPINFARRTINHQESAKSAAACSRKSIIHFLSVRSIFPSLIFSLTPAIYLSLFHPLILALSLRYHRSARAFYSPAFVPLRAETFRRVAR